MFARLAASLVGMAATGSGTGAGGAEADEHLAIVVDDVVDGQADQAGVLRYSDDDHIVRELGEPPAAGPGRNTPGPSGRAGPDTRNRPGPAAATYPARAGLRAAEPRPLRARGKLTSARTGPCREPLPPARAPARSTGPAPAGPRPGPRPARPAVPWRAGRSRISFLSRPDWRPGPGPGPSAIMAPYCCHVVSADIPALPGDNAAQRPQPGCFRRQEAYMSAGSKVDDKPGISPDFLDRARSGK